MTVGLNNNNNQVSFKGLTKGAEKSLREFSSRHTNELIKTIDKFEKKNGPVVVELVKPEGMRRTIFTTQGEYNVTDCFDLVVTRNSNGKKEVDTFELIDFGRTTKEMFSKIADFVCQQK